MKTVVEKNDKRQTILLLNAPILTDEGQYHMSRLPLATARDLVAKRGIESAIGHAATAAALTTLLDVPVPVNRVRAKQADGQSAIVFALNDRLPEGVVLDAAGIERIGYTLYLLHKDDLAAEIEASESGGAI